MSEDPKEYKTSEAAKAKERIVKRLRKYADEMRAREELARIDILQMKTDLEALERERRNLVAEIDRIENSTP